MTMNNPPLKRCCNEILKFIFSYSTGKVILMCEMHSKRFEYKTDLEQIYDYDTGVEVNLKEFFQLINNLLDKLVKKRQDNCDHAYQDRVVTGNGAFCGKCGKEEK